MNPHDPLRRKLLIGTLAGGCVIGISALTGCRDEPPEQSPDQAAADADRSGGKLDQAEAEYQDTPNGDEQCGNCVHFIAESNTCAIVKGTVRPEGWCKLWVNPDIA